VAALLHRRATVPQRHSSPNPKGFLLSLDLRALSSLVGAAQRPEHFRPYLASSAQDTHKHTSRRLPGIDRTVRRAGPPSEAIPAGVGRTKVMGRLSHLFAGNNLFRRMVRASTSSAAVRLHRRIGVRNRWSVRDRIRRSGLVRCLLGRSLSLERLDALRVAGWALGGGRSDTGNPVARRLLFVWVPVNMVLSRSVL